MKVDEILSYGKYLSPVDMRYGKIIKKNLSRKEMESLYDEKDESVKNGVNGFVNTSLKSFNSEFIFYNEHSELINLYKDYMSLIKNTDIFESEMNELKRARIYSEIEGSLNIEGYNSTRKLFDQLLNGKKPENINEIIIRNMSDALMFIESKPEFSKDNLKKLYSLLSNGCTTADTKMKKDDYYRTDKAFVSRYSGADKDEIDELMNSLFLFVNENLKSDNPVFKFFMPHIVHYYILYVHPYFDFNGRCARMCSLWISLLCGNDNSPYFISEAINQDKSHYYEAIENTRDTRNDLTYFLIYILNESVKYALAYLNVYEIVLAKKEERCPLTFSEMNYVKKILLYGDKRYFNHNDFITFSGTNITKQGALKILNNLEDAGILKSEINKKKEKLYIINDNKLKYRLHSLSTGAF